MKKIFVSVFLIFIIWLAYLFLFSQAEPATYEKSLDVLNNDLNSVETADNIKNYIRLIELFDMYKNGIIDSVFKETSVNCKEISLASDRGFKGTHLLQNLVETCGPVISKINHGSVYLQVCQNKDIALITRRTDHENYLYIKHTFYKKGFQNPEPPHKLCKEKLIEGKYYLVIEVEDAFNHIDPNNFSPN
jgi:hypothetical protein